MPAAPPTNGNGFAQLDHVADPVLAVDLAAEHQAVTDSGCDVTGFVGGVYPAGAVLLDIAEVLELSEDSAHGAAVDAGLPGGLPHPTPSAGVATASSSVSARASIPVRCPPSVAPSCSESCTPK
jgi:hypothetical protein